jgi:hypothetical protein
MEEAQYKFYRLRDDLTYYIAASPPDQLNESRIQNMFDEYQTIWDQLSNRWMEYRGHDGGEGRRANPSHDSVRRALS